MSITEQDTDMPVRPTKEQRQRRKDTEKIFFKGIKPLSKKYGFKSTRSFVYKVENGFFFHAFLSLNNIAIDNNYLEFYISLQVKPFEIDELYWELFDLEENKSQPLSFRANGCFVIQGPTLLERENITSNFIPNEENVLKILETGLELIKSKIDQFLTTYSIDTFDLNKFHFVGIANDKSLLEIMLPMLNNRPDEALRIIHEKMSIGEKGRYFKQDGTNIFDCVINYCERKLL